MSIGLVLLGSVYGVLIQVVGMSEVMRSQVTVNQSAREMFRILADGGIDASGAQNVEVPGMRGRSGTELSVSSYRATETTAAQSRLQAYNYSSIVSSTLPSTIIDCTAAGVPHRDCTGSGTTLTVVGTLADLTRATASTTLDNSTATNFNIAVIPVKLINPAMARRTYAVTKSAANSDLADRQTMVFRLQEGVP
ncbi:MAG: hypothetical protein H7840_01895 [Alphaproteobacteria bacterium]